MRATRFWLSMVGYFLPWVVAMVGAWICVFLLMRVYTGEASFALEVIGAIAAFKWFDRRLTALLDRYVAWVKARILRGAK